MSQYIKSMAALTAICAVVALLLSATNLLTAPIIAKNESAAANEALKVVMPDGEGFEAMDISSYTLPDTVDEVYKESNGGYVVKLTTAGYSTGMVIMCGVDANGVVTGATCLASSETLGAEKTYGENTVGKTLEDIDAVDTVASVTKTTSAYKNAVKDALNTAVILGGGSVDLRDEAQILQDNLSAALPAAEGKFTPWFMVEDFESVSAVYTADNQSGAVLVFGETFVAVDADGNVLTEGLDEATENAAKTYASALKASSISELDVSGFELPSAITKVEKTATNNYVFEVKASGYGINGGYGASGEFIVIRAALTPNGKVIACETVSQKETDGFGSSCADPSFYTQFNGKDETNYKEIDAISGATITTNGYKTAIGKLFEAVSILEGVA